MHDDYAPTQENGSLPADLEDASNEPITADQVAAVNITMSVDDYLQLIDNLKEVLAGIAVTDADLAFTDAFKESFLSLSQWYADLVVGASEGGFALDTEHLMMAVAIIEARVDSEQEEPAILDGSTVIL